MCELLKTAVSISEHRLDIEFNGEFDVNEIYDTGDDLGWNTAAEHDGQRLLRRFSLLGESERRRERKDEHTCYKATDSFEMMIHPRTVATTHDPQVWR